LTPVPVVQGAHVAAQSACGKCRFSRLSRDRTSSRRQGDESSGPFRDLLHGGGMVLLLWFYLSGVVFLLGVELNTEIEHASPSARPPAKRCPARCATEGHLPRPAQRLARSPPAPP
jgi:hypothetical protein